ncbi:MAG: hypothetical protein A2V90_02140 [Gammaproteobacteria bacterium RBG_16_57_12]|nr:MAG: hypothetical protein A2V90_02140 [Gammaproteobacteria bacterium RBG_16_57_12]
MNEQTIKTLLEAGMPGSQVQVQGDGRHFEIIVVSEAFAGKTMVQEQKMVYAVLNEAITRGELHAVMIKAYTPDEWSGVKDLQVLR